MNKQREIDAIEALIDRWAQTCSDEDFLELLSEMEDRAQTAREAREEELETDDE